MVSEPNGVPSGVPASVPKGSAKHTAKKRAHKESRYTIAVPRQSRILGSRTFSFPLVPSALIENKLRAKSGT